MKTSEFLKGMKKSGTADAFCAFVSSLSGLIADNKQMKVLFVSPKSTIQGMKPKGTEYGKHQHH